MALVVLRTEHDNADAQAAAAVRATVASTVSPVRTELRNELSAAVGQGAERVVPADRLAGAPISATAAITARDSGTTTLDDTARPAAMIVPEYRGGAAPASTAERRATIVAYRVVPLGLQPVLATLEPISGGLMVRGPDDLVAAAPHAAPAGAVVYGADMDITGSPGWVVQSWVAEPGIPGVGWLWALLVLAVFVAVAAAMFVLQRRNAVAAARLRVIEHNRTLFTGLASVMQSSLDLGEVAPALASHLSDGLHLDGLSLATPGDRGEKHVFAWGTPPDRTVRPVTSMPDSLAAGETLAIALTRGGRTLGVLRVRAGRALGRDDLVPFGGTTDMLGSTLANAEAFASQQELVERMRSVDELKTVFLATASHELRTPVTAIVGFSTLLLDRWDSMNPAQQRGLLERVQSNGARLNTLIEQLLDFSQLERGLPRSNDELLDLGETVRRILSDQPELKSDHELKLDIMSGCRVRGSTAALERIVTNLVGNAAKYSPRGTTITVRVRPEGRDHAVLLVDDQGSGVPDEDREKVFSRFYRGRGDSVTRTRGAGIGLAIVSEYAASMSGTARVTDAPSGGARFAITFPMITTYAHPSTQGATDVAVS
jgi:signal transduction histidine kinase